MIRHALHFMTICSSQPSSPEDQSIRHETNKGLERKSSSPHSEPPFEAVSVLVMAAICPGMRTSMFSCTRSACSFRPSSKVAPLPRSKTAARNISQSTKKSQQHGPSAQWEAARAHAKVKNQTVLYVPSFTRIMLACS